MNVLLIVIAIIVGVVGLQVINDVLNDLLPEASYGSQTWYTLVKMVPVAIAIGLMILGFKATE